MKKRLFSIIIFILILVTLAAPFSASAFTVSPDYASKINVPIYNLVCVSENNAVLASKNSGKKVFPSSLTMLMTALVAHEHLTDIEADIKVSEEAVNCLIDTGALGCDLKIGEIMSVKDHLYRMLIGSRADSATTLAVESAGSVEKFIELMNKKAAELGMANTTFKNCVGLYDPEHLTTAEDLTRLALEFIKNETLTKICSSILYEMDATNKTGSRGFYSTNLMIQASSKYYYTYTDGLRYASSSQSGRCIITTATYEDRKYLCVALGGELTDQNGETLHDEMTSTRQLYRWAFLNLASKNTVDKNIPIAEIPVELSLDDYVSLVAEKDVYILVPKDSVITYDVYYNSESGKASAPIKKGDVLGYADIVCAGERVGQVNLVALNDVSANPILYAWNWIVELISTTAFQVAFISVIAALVLGIWIWMQIKRKRKIKQKRNRYRKF
ncbi:MAG: D-alanyl-D-alanine carboxypeptidase [Clostridia bacterium]|nr:D-alanyl-D-alanine carboxypeptidase [Clostridia bacterium]